MKGLPRQTGRAVTTQSKFAMSVNLKTRLFFIRLFDKSHDVKSTIFMSKEDVP
jgi:hypothetical protein